MDGYWQKLEMNSLNFSSLAWLGSASRTTDTLLDICVWKEIKKISTKQQFPLWNMLSRLIGGDWCHVSISGVESERRLCLPQNLGGSCARTVRNGSQCAPESVAHGMVLQPGDVSGCFSLDVHVRNMPKLLPNLKAEADKARGVWEASQSRG